ncbi:MAG TPA: hypothetical protein VMP41_15750 [Acidimicrobiales bacterium]|nr:hypothetical protein [Acidimicrobiales bacterium]
MLAILATDPGAWNIIGWMLVLAALGGVIVWLVTTLLLRSGSTDRSEGREARPS